MCRRCAWDIFNLGVHRRLLGAVRQYIAVSIWRRNIGRKFQCMHLIFSRCPDALAKHSDYSRTSPIIRRTTDVWGRCPGDAQIYASRKHRGTVALDRIGLLLQNGYTLLCQILSEWFDQMSQMLPFIIEMSKNSLQILQFAMNRRRNESKLVFLSHITTAY